MKRSTGWIIAGSMALTALATMTWLVKRGTLPNPLTAAKHHAEDESSETKKPIAKIKTAVATLGDVVRTTEAYGTVSLRPGANFVIQPRSEVAIRRVLVQPGQDVTANDPLCEVESTPAALGELELARAEVESTTKQYEAAQEKQRMNLGTRQDLLQAEATQQQAKIKLTQLQTSLPDPSGVIRAPVDGRIIEAHVDAGAVMAPNAPLFELLPRDAIIVLLGVEPSDAGKLAPGQAISVQTLDSQSPQTLNGIVQFVTSAIDPASRLVNVQIVLPKESSLRMGQSVRGAIETKAVNTLIVPRAAVLPREDQHIVFTVENGIAHEHIVQVGLQNHGVIQITGGDLKPGDEVVTQGNYELEDEMAVERDR